MKTLKMIAVLILFGFITSCSTTNEAKIAQKDEQKIENSLEKQAKKLAKKFENENYQISDLADMEDAIYTYLKLKLNPGSISEETKVNAPTDNIGKTKCIINIKGRVARMICDSIRYRMSDATGGNEVTKEYTDKFFSATEHLGVLNLGYPDYSFVLIKKINKNTTEYRMFAVYTGEKVNNSISNGIKFGNQIKEYIDNGLSK